MNAPIVFGGVRSSSLRSLLAAVAFAGAAVAFLLAIDIATAGFVEPLLPDKCVLREPPLDTADRAQTAPAPSATVSPSLALPSDEPGVAIDLVFAPGFAAEDLHRFLAATGSRICLVDFKRGQVTRYVAPGRNGLPAGEASLRSWPSFLQAHTEGWTWIPCPSAPPVLRAMQAEWPDFVPCLLLAPASAGAVWGERRRLLAAGAFSRPPRTIVELAAAAGSAPKLFVTLQEGA